MATTDLSSLYEALSRLRITRSQVRALLPSWWDDEAAASPGGYWELLILLARRLGVDPAALSAGNARPQADLTRVLFKRTAGTLIEDLQPAALIASALARLVASAVGEEYQPFPPDPVDVRRNATPQAGLLTLQALCNHAWSRGVPVVPIFSLPSGLRKMDAMVENESGRPVVLLARKQTSRAWQAFILAHEIGHLALGHVRSQAALVDGDLTGQERPSDGDDTEKAANNFALALFAGSGDQPFKPEGGRRGALTAVALAADASTHAERYAIDRAHVVLRHAFTTGDWNVAMDALRFFPEDRDADTVIREALASRIDFDRLSDDNAEYIRAMVGL